ncbi:hypothetical protein A5707_21985 [Mycobacterium kyorinense]|uniref:DUF2599 domain-containing protein n=1 Tax=Mycobacterium kyorinense TaxID=487514 RepID=A0A1A2Z9C2_9MYCO|nr:DUF2599 domain-containing protein [Mycobacterium kyorinense]OBI46117.1 hypothetical protein A5707_21985 [Mycobacterium kyorinense]
MRAFAVPAAALPALLLAAPVAADPAYAPPFVDHTEWVQWGRQASLRVYPTAAARTAARQAVTDSTAADEAWAEVLRRAPNADTPGMRQQFVCHWQVAEFVEPGKTSWNLEPWRPVVDDATMIGSGCNPGGAEEPF